MITPLPEPRPDETEDDFMDRCTSSDIMKEEFKDDQIVAVCQSIWDQSEKEGDNSVGNKKMELRKVTADFEVRQKENVM